MLYFTFRLGKDFEKNETVTPTFLDLMNTLAENSNEVHHFIKHNKECEELFTIDADFIPELLDDTLAAFSAFEDYNNKRPEFDRLISEYLETQEKFKFREATDEEATNAARKLAKFGNEMIESLKREGIDNTRVYLLPEKYDDYNLLAAIDFLRYICLMYFYDEAEKYISPVDRGLSIKIIKL